MVLFYLCSPTKIKISKNFFEKWGYISGVKFQISEGVCEIFVNILTFFAKRGCKIGTFVLTSEGDFFVSGQLNRKNPEKILEKWVCILRVKFQISERSF